MVSITVLFEEIELCTESRLEDTLAHTRVWAHSKYNRTYRCRGPYKEGLNNPCRDLKLLSQHHKDYINSVWTLFLAMKGILLGPFGAQQNFGTLLFVLMLRLSCPAELYQAWSHLAWANVRLRLDRWQRPGQHPWALHWAQVVLGSTTILSWGCPLCFNYVNRKIKWYIFHD